LKSVTNFANLAVDPTKLTNRFGELFWPKNDQRQQQDDNDLASRQIEHTLSLITEDLEVEPTVQYLLEFLHRDIIITCSNASPL
jgi:hypothetical protein